MAILSLILVLSAGGWLLWSGFPVEKPEALVDQKAAQQQRPDAIRETVEGQPKGGAGHLVTSIMTKDLQPKQAQATPGTWATSKTFVKGRYDRLEAVEIHSDTEAWTRMFPGPICGTTPLVTVDGRTAVLFRDRENKDLCNQVALVNLDTGEKLWQATFPGGSRLGYTTDPTTVTMTRGVVVITWEGKGVAAYDMRDGKKLWLREKTQQCNDSGTSGGQALLVLRACAAASIDSLEYQAQRIDARTGKVKWTYKVAKGVKGAFLVSSDPPVLGVGAGDAKITDLLSLDDEGKYRSTIRLEGDHYEVKCDVFLIDRCSQVVVSKDQAFITSSEQLESVGEATNWIVGFSLATGRAHVKFDAGSDQMLYPIRMSGDDLLAYKTSTDDYAPRSLVSLDPVSGKQRVYFYFSVASENIGLGYGGDLSDVIVEHGRIFFGALGIKGAGQKGSPLLVTSGFGIGRAS
ncbi:PQQ-binding-like beta-propeller repeat protein [Streptomyces sp. NPDC050095]|uniref:outer membrane protein assembly factor BamB family protein n=1 Tax=unclassified Streptomyces TaxID=2593676 RepID=UPI00343DB6AA